MDRLRRTPLGLVQRQPLERRLPAAFTLVEMLATVAMLVILLGLSVSLARHVRDRSAQAMTIDVLRQLDQLATRYAARHNGNMPPVTLFPPPQAVSAGRVSPEGPIALDPPRADLQLLRRTADRNNREFVAALRSDVGSDLQPLAGLPASLYDQAALRDAWGSPIVFMPTSHPWVGTARRDKTYFFFSAGPDRDYLTRDDNLYSYEE
jgi:type II secretory pathway pseudopilin PulG